MTIPSHALAASPAHKLGSARHYAGISLPIRSAKQTGVEPWAKHSISTLQTTPSSIVSQEGSLRAGSDNSPSSIFEIWRQSLSRLHDWFNKKRDAGRRQFYFKSFSIFFAINLGCYWWALLTAYPGHIMSYKWDEFFLMGFPVSFLGATFDSFSLIVTLFIIRQALVSDNNLRYVAFLSVDLVIAGLAALWVLFAFVASGWVVALVLQRPETFASRTVLYQGRFWDAFEDPFAPGNIRNIYFGTIMGASALLPTLCHLFLAMRSLVRWVLCKMVPELQ
jgi:hypothetical protein